MTEQLARTRALWSWWRNSRHRMAWCSPAGRPMPPGYRRMDAYSPYPLEEAADAIGFEKTQVPLLTLIGGILGGLSGFLMQYWIHV